MHPNFTRQLEEIQHFTRHFQGSNKLRFHRRQKTLPCLRELQLITLPFRHNTPPMSDLLSAISAAKSASLNASIRGTYVQFSADFIVIVILRLTLQVSTNSLRKFSIVQAGRVALWTSYPQVTGTGVLLDQPAISMLQAALRRRVSLHNSHHQSACALNSHCRVRWCAGVHQTPFDGRDYSSHLH